MTFTFLQEEIESILVVATAPFYITIIALLQAKNLKALAQLKRKKLTEKDKGLLIGRLRKLKRMTPIFMLLVAILHVVAYFIFATAEIRSAYFISIFIMYTIYVLIALINFYLKGAGILKDIGNFNGLPGG